MNLQKIKYFLSYGIILLFAACQEELGFREPSGSDKSQPSQVTEVQVTNLPGKAKITYQLPIDDNLLYVKATYTLASGQAMEVKASPYKDSLIVEGFGDTLEHQVRLVTVSRAEVESAPINVTVKPKRAPIWDVFESITVINAFGGYKLSALNPTMDRIGILVMQRNDFDEWEADNNLSIFTTAETVKGQASGMDTLVHWFAFAVRDRWGNVTDTLVQDIYPIFEKELDIANFRHNPLTGDPGQQWGASVQSMWDKRYGWPVCFTSLATETLKVPAIVTIDMGVEAKISKVWIRPYRENSGYYYTFCTPKRFELYGSMGTNPTLDDTWFKLGTYELNKPSNSPGAYETAEDKVAAEAGFYYEADINAPKVRYFRIRCLENWVGNGPLAIDELRIFGDPR